MKYHQACCREGLPHNKHQQLESFSGSLQPHFQQHQCKQQQSRNQLSIHGKDSSVISIFGFYANLKICFFCTDSSIFSGWPTIYHLYENLLLELGSKFSPNSQKHLQQLTKDIPPTILSRPSDGRTTAAITSNNNNKNKSENNNNNDIDNNIRPCLSFLLESFQPANFSEAFKGNSMCWLPYAQIAHCYLIIHFTKLLSIIELSS